MIFGNRVESKGKGDKEKGRADTGVRSPTNHRTVFSVIDCFISWEYIPRGLINDCSSDRLCMGKEWRRIYSVLTPVSC